jgi:ParB family chromosome partitioning protein
MSAKPRGLGRGLDALLGGAGAGAGADAPAAAGAERGASLPIGALQPGRYQPRTHMDEAALGELADSIRAQGVLQPILVRPVGEGRHEIIAGERRWRAARLAGLAEVPVLIRDIPDEAALAMALIENIQREDLNPLEEAQGIERLVREFGMTHQAAAEAVGRSRTAVTNLLRLLNLPPPVQEQLVAGALEMGHARALLALPGATKQIEFGRVVAERGLSVRETERLVARALAAPPARRPRAADRDVLRLEETIADALGASVRLKPGRKGAGRLEIQYRSLDQFDALLARLGVRPD